jgi:hypothetical protein
MITLSAWRLALGALLVFVAGAIAQEYFAANLLYWLLTGRWLWE